jgi:hypothetical protein
LIKHGKLQLFVKDTPASATYSVQKKHSIQTSDIRHQHVSAVDLGTFGTFGTSSQWYIQQSQGALAT